MQRRVRVLVGLAVLIAAVTGTGGNASAGPERPANVVQWRGHLGVGIVTNCDPVAMADCDAWLVFASRESLRSHANATSSTELAVVVFDVVWVDGVPHETYRAEGFLPGAHVVIPHNVAWAEAHGEVDLEVCEEVPGEHPEHPDFVCESIDESVALDLRWDAVSRAERYRDGWRFGDPGEMLAGRAWGAARIATLDATVDGEQVVAVAPPYGDPPMLFNDAVAELCLRCGLEPPL